MRQNALHKPGSTSDKASHGIFQFILFFSVICQSDPVASMRSCQWIIYWNHRTGPGRYFSRLGFKELKTGPKVVEDRRFLQLEAATNHF